MAGGGATGVDAILSGDLSTSRLVLLGFCLLAALVFEFVNGFHDTANAVATVIYTNTLRPVVAVVYSGLLNFLGVLLGGIAVAMAIVHLLPVELLVSSGVGKGLAMVLALLAAAVLWNAGTWYLGLPASSSHTLIGAILGVGLMSSWMDGTQGVNWSKAEEVGLWLLLSPVIGFCLAAALLWILHKTVTDKTVFDSPKGKEPPKPWVRAVLVLTCGGVSFAHGSNDGQKGVGVIMLILIGLVPTGFALNLDASPALVRDAQTATAEMQRDIASFAENCATDPARPGCVASRELDLIAAKLAGRTRLFDIPEASRWKVRQNFLQLDNALTSLEKVHGGSSPALARIEAERKRIAPITDYAPTWVIFAVALALGVGTMVGWKRIVVTIGEKIGKTHLTYAQGASAEMVAVLTIGFSTAFGFPVSTTQVLSSGVAGTMAAEKSGLQFSTLKKIGAAWLLTLPAAMTLSGVFFFILAKILA